MWIRRKTSRKWCLKRGLLVSGGPCYDGIYRQKLSTDYRAHVVMNIYLYLMNIYSYLWCMNLSGER
jgi:hypothetical protein